MKKFSLALLAIAAALAITPAALADSFNFTFSAGTVTATGTLTGSEIGNTGEWFITGGTIDITSGGIVQGAGSLYGVLPSSPGNVPITNVGFGGTNMTYDNLLTPGANPQLDGNGLIFEVDGTGISIWGNGSNDYALWEGNWAYIVRNGASFDATPAPTPEPSSLLLLGTGLLGLAFVAFRKAKSSGLVTHS
jgi:PEP-CTERM motif